MNRQEHKRIAQVGVMTATVVVLGVATLWSWNTLAELLGGPQAQFKHIAAAAIILTVLRWTTNANANRHLRPASWHRTSLPFSSQ